MRLEPVQGYNGANYPSLADYFKGTGKGGRLAAWTLALALASLATLLSGCD